MIKKVFRDGTNRIRETVYYVYDKEGKLLEERISPPEHPVVLSEYTYDTEGNRMKTTRSVEGRNILSTVSSFNTDNKVMKETRTDGQSGFLETKSYEYDDVGNLIKREIRDAEGNIISDKYTYDCSGNPIKHIKKVCGCIIMITTFTFDDNNKLLQKTLKKENPVLNEYDNTGKLIKRTQFFGGRVNIYHYNTKGKVMREIVKSVAHVGDKRFKWTGASEKRLYDKVIIDYNGAGRVVKRIITTSEGYTVYEHKYGNANNLIKKIITNGDCTVVVEYAGAVRKKNFSGEYEIRRTITYPDGKTEVALE